MLKVVATIMASYVIWAYNGRVTKEILAKDPRHELATKLGCVIASWLFLGTILWAIWS